MPRPLHWQEVGKRWRRFKWLYISKSRTIMRGAQSLPEIEAESVRYGGGQFGGWIELTPQPPWDSNPPA